MGRTFGRSLVGAVVVSLVIGTFALPADAATTTIRVSDASGAEPPGAGTVDFTISARRLPRRGAVKVNYATRDLSPPFAAGIEPAKADVDYQPVSGIAKLSRKSPAVTVSVPINDDGFDNADEVLELVLSRARDAKIADGIGTGTITDDLGDEDADGDGLSLTEESTFGTDPDDADSDDDELIDGFEVDEVGTDPLDDDSDDDGRLDAVDDEDGDRVPNKFDQAPQDEDADDDGTGDYFEDDDADGWSDFADPEPNSGGEAGFTLESDVDGDGLPWAEDPHGLFTDYDEDGCEDPDEIDASGDPFDPDTDDDGALDGEEFDHGSSLTRDDTDGDSLGDKFEIDNGMRAWSRDSDSDGVSDPHELRLGLDPIDIDTDGDTISDGDENDDGDGLTMSEELQVGTDPFAGDTDLDGILDDEEDDDDDGLDTRGEIDNGSDPWGPDSDIDGLSDADEVTLGTSPLDPDSDFDGLEDGLEIAAGTDPLDDDSDDDGTVDGSEDSDGDGINDGLEPLAGTDLNDEDSDDDTVGDAEDDTDGDGIPNLIELSAVQRIGDHVATDDDSDDDGTIDGGEDWDIDGLTNLQEVQFGSSIIRRDTDQDRLPDPDEFEANTDPTDNDSDDDGVGDLHDVLGIVLTELSEDGFDAGIQSGYTFVAINALWCGLNAQEMGFLRAARDAPPTNLNLAWHLGSDDVDIVTDPVEDYELVAFPTAILFGPGGVELGRLIGAPGSDPSAATAHYIALIAQIDGFASDGTITQSELATIDLDNWEPAA